MSSNKQTFLDLYRKYLELERISFPEKYCWDIARLDEIATQVVNLFATGESMAITPAIVSTCKDLGIQRKCKSIMKYLTQDE